MGDDSESEREERWREGERGIKLKGERYEGLLGTHMAVDMVNLDCVCGVTPLYRE